MYEFPISGVETYWWLPGLVAFLIASLTSTGGVTGAFILLPFQVSILGYTTPGASPTNLLYNIIAIPSGVWRYHRDRRMVWPLAYLTTLGTLPGVVLGVALRLKYLPDPRAFKLFAGVVLLLLGAKLAHDVIGRKKTARNALGNERFEVGSIKLSFRKIGFSFNKQTYETSTMALGAFSFIVGVVGGAYGIGGGAILAPFMVAVLHLPVHAVAGAALVGTFITSVVGILTYIFLGPLISGSSTAAMPDWLLGISFGVGGALGVYVGARLQRYFPARLIKGVLVTALLIIAAKYIAAYFW